MNQTNCLWPTQSSLGFKKIEIESCSIKYFNQIQQLLVSFDPSMENVYIW